MKCSVASRRSTATRRAPAGQRHAAAQLASRARTSAGGQSAMKSRSVASALGDIDPLGAGERDEALRRDAHRGARIACRRNDDRMGAQRRVGEDRQR